MFFPVNFESQLFIHVANKMPVEGVQVELWTDA